MKYSLDGSKNISFENRIELTGLDKGSHKLVVYAKDSAGNVVVSTPVIFTIKFHIQIPFKCLYEDNLFVVIALVGSTIGLIIFSKVSLKGVGLNLKKMKNSLKDRRVLFFGRFVSKPDLFER